ncbi:hypothetical protein [Yunchengibacter salinarum]|uniref:hypothetical protein n=1 Tax=Yunchengibacter salinarum TaxID=3133399 RepID=UPI0035B66F56
MAAPMIVALMALMMVLLSPAPAVFAQDEPAVDVVELDPFNFSILRRGRVNGIVTLILRLEVTGDMATAEVEKRKPQIRSDFMTGLATLARQRFHLDRPIDPELVRRYLQPVADRRLGEGAVAVLVKSARVEPPG